MTAKFTKGQLRWHAGVPVRAHTCLFLRFTAKMNLFLGSISCSSVASRNKMIAKKLADSSVRNGKPNFKMKDPQNFYTLLSFNWPLHGLAMRNTILVFTHRRKNERKSSKLLTVVRFNIIKICLCCISELSSNLFTNMGLVGWKASIACRKDDWIKSFLCFLQWGFLTILWFSDKIISIWKKVLALEPDWPRLQSHFHDFLNWHYLNS